MERSAVRRDNAAQREQPFVSDEHSAVGVTTQLSETAAGLQVIVLTAVERIFHAAAASALAVLPYRREA